MIIYAIEKYFNTKKSERNKKKWKQVNYYIF
jgi:hypothetical protein